MSSPVITLENVTKTFRLRSSGTRSLKSAALDLLRGGRAATWLHALKDAQLSVAAGETLGIIGANGAGKSTLLALIAGTLTPTAGRITTRGNISSLLELGAGFHPDLTGRENIYLYGAIMGLTRRQMRERFDAIVAFAELSDFIDQPVKHYSSGMYVRLGFAVAVEVDPDILLIDEVLAVGDVNFQRKCLQKMEEFRRKGRTMLIISHDLPTIQRISDRILFLDHGKVLGVGMPDAMVGEYETLSRDRLAEGIQREWGTGEVRMKKVRLLDGRGCETAVFRWGELLEAEIRYEAARSIRDPVFGFAIRDRDGRLVFGSNTQIDALAIPEVCGEGVVRLKVGPLTMSAGPYLLSFSTHSADHRTNYHRLDNCCAIAVECDKPFEGCHMPTRWSLEK
jgi:ABC-type polysaccharide/polyol phosphate transport system ATPase subunit